MSNLSRREFIKIAGFTTGGVAFARFLAACGTAAQQTSAPVVAQVTAAPVATEKTSAPVHMVLGSYVFGNVPDVYKKMVGEYTAKNPNLTIDFEFADYSGFMDKLTTEIAAGTQPDIAMLIPDALPKYYAQDLLMDLDALVKAANVDPSKWYANAWLGVQFGPDKHYYSVPLTWDADVLWYNKKIFDKAGAKYPDETWTYDNLVDAAKALTVVEGGNTTQWGLGIGWEPWYQIMGMFGVEPWDKQDFEKSSFDKPEVIDAVQKAADFYVKHKTTPVEPPNSGLAVNGADTQFIAGNMAMLLGGTWMTQTYLDPNSGVKDFGFDNALSPMNPTTKQRMTIGQPNAFIIFKKTKYPEESWKLVHELCVSENGQNTLAPQVEIPALKSAAEGTYKKDWLSKLGHPDIQLETMDKYAENVQYGLLDENTWMVEVDNELDAVWKGADVATTCKALAAKLDQLYGEAKAKYGKK